MSKIVDFASLKNKIKGEDKERPEVDEDGFYEHKELDQLAMEWTFQFVDDLAEADIGDDTEEYCRDQAYFHEALKSLIYRCHGVEHPFHSIVDENIRIVTAENGEFDAYWDSNEEDVDK